MMEKTLKRTERVNNMKNKLCKKESVYAVIIVLIVLAVVPSINADNFSIIKNTDDEDPTCLGSIYGNTGILYIWGFSPVRFAKVTAGDKTTISGPIMGEYKICGLPLDTYTVIGSKKGYKSYTTTVTLTERHPNKQVFIDLQPNNVNLGNPEVETTFNDYDPLNFGILFGSTLWAKGWACGPLRFAQIYARGENYKRIRISGIFGNFILIIPLNKEITITASKLRYETETKTIMLTNEKRYDYVFFMLNVL